MPNASRYWITIQTAALLYSRDQAARLSVNRALRRTKSIFQIVAIVFAEPIRAAQQMKAAFDRASTADPVRNRCFPL